MTLKNKIIEAKTLDSNTSTVTFNSIPNTYTDLILLASLRCSATDSQGVLCRLNSDTGNNYHYRSVYVGSGSAKGSYVSKNTSFVTFGSAQPGNGPSDVFSSHRLYIPRYANSSFYKSLVQESASEWNSNASAYHDYTHGFWRNTAAITTITLTIYNGSNFLTGSSFYLYGI